MAPPTSVIYSFLGVFEKIFSILCLSSGGLLVKYRLCATRRNEMGGKSEYEFGAITNKKDCDRLAEVTKFYQEDSCCGKNPHKIMCLGSEIGKEEGELNLRAIREGRDEGEPHDMSISEKMLIEIHRLNLHQCFRPDVYTLLVKDIIKTPTKLSVQFCFRHNHFTVRMGPTDTRDVRMWDEDSGLAQIVKNCPNTPTPKLYDMAMHVVVGNNLADPEDTSVIPPHVGAEMKAYAHLYDTFFRPRSNSSDSPSVSESDLLDSELMADYYFSSDESPSDD